MVELKSVEPLFKEEAPVPKDTLKDHVVRDIKLREFTGIPEERLQISFNAADGSDILLKVIDPRAAAGYLVFKDESEYTGWLNSHLYEPSQEEVQEAARRGSGA